jgi:Cu2+-containing amine oxidase
MWRGASLLYIDSERLANADVLHPLANGAGSELYPRPFGSRFRRVESVRLRLGEKMTTEKHTTGPHHLEPLTEVEIRTTARVVRSQRHIADGWRFVSISLHEPPKEKVLGFENGAATGCETFAVLLDKVDAKTYEAVVSLPDGTI